MKKKHRFAEVARRFYAKLEKPEYAYLFIALVGVIGFALITPPFQGPDEESHYVRAQYIAHGFLVPVDVNKSDASLPKSILKVAHTTFYDDDIRGKTNFNYELYRSKQALKTQLNSNGSYKPQMISYSPVPYLPAIPGIILANLLNASPLISLYAARFLLGISSVVIIFFSIRLIPYKKYLLTVVGLVPMMLFQQAMVTVDSISYALLILFIAYLLHLREKTTITSRQWLLLGALCLAIVLAKPLVFLFLPLTLILIKKKDSLVWIGGIAAVCVVVLAGWTLLTSTKHDVITVAGTPDNVSSSRQLSVLEREPKRGLRVLWNSYMTFYGDDEVRGVIGIFGAADTIYPIWMTLAYAILIGIVTMLRFSGESIFHLETRWKVLTISLCALYFIAVNLALYLSYTPVNFDIVYGVQGRYFLPILITLATLLSTGGMLVLVKDSMKTKKRVIMVAFWLVLLALFITYQRYYMYTP